MMLMSVQPETAGNCAQKLIVALKCGMPDQIEHAVNRIVRLRTRVTCDSRELEFRDLLEGIVERLTAGHKPVESRLAALRMLAHVAGTAN